MGNNKSKTREVDEKPLPPTAVDAAPVEDDLSDLIAKASKTSLQPVGAAERQLLLALEVFSLMDRKNDSVFNSSSSVASTRRKSHQNSTTAAARTLTPFAEMFKWSVLSMLRCCSICSSNASAKKHCHLQRQALILPPFKLPQPTSGIRMQNPLVDAFVDVVEEPALRFICDDCLSLVHVPRYEAIQAEVRKVAQRTRGFSGGTMYIDIVDGPSVCGRSTVFGPGEEQPTKGVSQVQNNLLLPAAKNDDNDRELGDDDAATFAEEKTRRKTETVKSGIKKGKTDQEGDDDEQEDDEDLICVNGLSLGGLSLTDQAVASILRNPDLKRVTIHFPTTLGSAGAPRKTGGGGGGGGGDLVDLLGLHPKSLRSVEELKLSGPSHNIVDGNSKETFPLKYFTKLQSLVVQGFTLTPKDLQSVIDGLLRAGNDSSSTTSSSWFHPKKKAEGKSSSEQENQLGCQFLQNVIIVNQNVLSADDVLDTIGQLPLSLLSIANMNISSDSAQSSRRRMHQQCAAKPPILVSQLVLWGSNATILWMSSNLLPRSQFLTSIDISSTNIFVTQFLDACAGADLGLLRVVRANDCTGGETNFPSGGATFAANANGPNPRSRSDGQQLQEDNDDDEDLEAGDNLATSSSSSPSSSYIIQDGVRKQVTSWQNLASLSTLQIRRLRVEPNRGLEQVQKFATLPALTSIDVSFVDEVAEDCFTDHTVLGQLRVLSHLNFQSSSKNAYNYNYGQAATVPRRRRNAASASALSALTLPNLHRLHIHCHPTFLFSFNGAPRLRELIFAGSQHSETLREFIEQGAGSNAERLSFSGEPGNANLELPLDSCPRLKKLAIHNFGYFSTSTVAALSSCTNLTKLDLSDLKSSKAIARSFSLESALVGMKNLEELDLSNTAMTLSFTGTPQAVLPKLKKFWKREDNRSAAAAGESPNLLQWLSFQPHLEEVDVEGACVDLDDLPCFWPSSSMRHSIAYLNVANVIDRARSNRAVKAVFASMLSTSQTLSRLKVLKWFHQWCGREAETILESIPSLKFLEIKCLCFDLPPSDESNVEEEIPNSFPWSYSFVEKMTKKGVQLRNSEGYSFIRHLNKS